MISREQYAPGAASAAGVQKNGEKWTLILVRDLRHAREVVWQALSDPAHLRQWAPFDAEGDLSRAGATIRLTWTGTGQTVETTVTRAEPPRALEFADIRWELEPSTLGTRLTLWHSIDRRFISWGAAGWHICFDVLDHLLAGNPIGRIAGRDATLFGWNRLVAEYAQQFSGESPDQQPGPDAS